MGFGSPSVSPTPSQSQAQSQAQPQYQQQKQQQQQQQQQPQSQRNPLRQQASLPVNLSDLTPLAPLMTTITPSLPPPGLPLAEPPALLPSLVPAGQSVRAGRAFLHAPLLTKLSLPAEADQVEDEWHGIDKLIDEILEIQSAPVPMAAAARDEESVGLSLSLFPLLRFEQPFFSFFSSFFFSREQVEELFDNFDGIYMPRRLTHYVKKTSVQIGKTLLLFLLLLLLLDESNPPQFVFTARVVVPVEHRMTMEEDILESLHDALTSSIRDSSSDDLRAAFQGSQSPQDSDDPPDSPSFGRSRSKGVQPRSKASSRKLDSGTLRKKSGSIEKAPNWLLSHWLAPKVSSLSPPSQQIYASTKLINPLAEVRLDFTLWT